jgi:3-deoxy-manno-octulosonate cytidylyltransferase (CMP-KDO synthetase)
MQVFAVIPARYESSRFPGKPLAMIAGVPMIRRVYDRTAAAGGVSEVYVATDDRRIYDTVLGFGGNAVMTGSENPTGTDRAAEVARRLSWAPEDIVVNVQGDQPLIEPRSLSAVIAPLVEDRCLLAATLAFRIVNPREITDPKDVKVVFDQRGNALYFSRSTVPFRRDPETPRNVYKHLGVYAYRKRFLDTFRRLPCGRLEDIEKLEQLRVLENGYTIRVVVTEFDSPEVDLPADIPRIEAVLLEGEKGGDG